MWKSEVERKLVAIRNMKMDSEAAHAAEDELFVEVLRAIAGGKCEDPGAVARVALRSRRIPFKRRCA